MTLFDEDVLHADRPNKFYSLGSDSTDLFQIDQTHFKERHRLR